MNFIYKEKDFSQIFLKIINEIDNLKNSRQSDGLSLRELFGLCIITTFRKNIEQEKDWFFTTEKNISDDGAISFFKINKNDIDYPYEKIEQVYLPIFFKKNNNESYQDLLLRFLNNKKLNKNDSYKFNKSLLLLNDIDTKQGFDYVNVLQKIFPKNQINYSHFYYIGYLGQTDAFLSYIILSYTDKPYRSFLNGQFRFFLYKNGDYKFKKIQDININDILRTDV